MIKILMRAFFLPATLFFEKLHYFRSPSMSSIKRDYLMAVHELPDFLRRLAVALESKSASDPDFLNVDRIRKFKCEVDDRGVRFRMKFSEDFCLAVQERHSPLDTSHPIHPHHAAEKPGYKELKKRMRKDFKAMFKAIHEGVIPDRRDVMRFLSDAHLMVTYPGYGDVYYSVFIDACHAFEKAYEQGDLQLLNETVDALAFQAAHCHSRFK